MKTQPNDLSKILNRYSSKWVALKPDSTSVVAVGGKLSTVIEKLEGAE